MRFRSGSLRDGVIHNFGDIQWMENRVSSDYNSFQVSLEKRLSKGLTGLLSYTLGEATTDAPDHISTSGGGAGVHLTDRGFTSKARNQL